MGKISIHEHGVTITYEAPEYATSTLYTRGDVVMHDGKLYECITSTRGIWLPSHWEAITLSQLLDKELGL